MVDCNECAKHCDRLWHHMSTITAGLEAQALDRAPNRVDWHFPTGDLVSYPL